MDKTIELIRNNDKKDWTDLEWIEEFYNFLQGTNPKSVKCKELKLSKEESFRIIWYLQEHFSLLPDNIEQCEECRNLFNANSEGYYSESQGSHFCECSADEEYSKDNP